MIDVWRGAGFENVDGCDLTTVAVDRLTRRFPSHRFLNVDISSTQIPYSSEFDAVSSNDVLFHIVDDAAYQRALTNIFGALRPGGYFVFSDNFLHGPTLRSEHQVSRSLEEITFMLRQAGFSIIARRPLFVLMNNPVDSSSRFLRLWWRKLSGALSRPGLGGALGAILYGPELGLVRIVKDGPSTEVMVCRRPDKLSSARQRCDCEPVRLRYHSARRPSLARSTDASPEKSMHDGERRSDRNVSRRSRPLRVSVLGPPELFADRTVDLLRSQGIDARRPKWPADGRFRAPRVRLERIRRGLATDVFFHMYGQRHLGRMESWLARLGVPTLILWIGDDVVIDAPKASKSVTEQAWHWCRTPWLQDELADVGVAAEVLLMSPPRIPDHVPALPSTFTVLAYALDGQDERYGLDFVLELARRRPDIQFLLLAATSTDSLPENVTALGWVDDIHDVMSQTTLYVRPTSHDGLAYLVLEALAYGRYVLWTYPFPGAETAVDVDAAEARLDELYRQHVEGRLSPNQAGREAVLEMFEPSVVGDAELRAPDRDRGSRVEAPSGAVPTSDRACRPQDPQGRTSRGRSMGVGRVDERRRSCRRINSRDRSSPKERGASCCSPSSSLPATAGRRRRSVPSGWHGDCQAWAGRPW